MVFMPMQKLFSIVDMAQEHLQFLMEELDTVFSVVTHNNKDRIFLLFCLKIVRSSKHLSPYLKLQ